MQHLLAPWRCATSAKEKEGQERVSRNLTFLLFLPWGLCPQTNPALFLTERNHYKTTVSGSPQLTALKQSQYPSRRVHFEVLTWPWHGTHFSEGGFTPLFQPAERPCLAETKSMSEGAPDTTQPDMLLEPSRNDSRIKEAFEVHGGVGRGVNLENLSVYPRAQGEQSTN